MLSRPSRSATKRLVAGLPVALLYLLTACAGPAASQVPTATTPPTPTVPAPATTAARQQPAPSVPPPGSPAAPSSPSALPSPSSVSRATATPGSSHSGAADWLRTVRDSPLWSGPTAQAQQFNVVPVGSYVQPTGNGAGGRILVFYTGDGRSRAAGQAWIAADDGAPSGPPPWIVTSELDWDDAKSRFSSTIQRQSPAAPPLVSAEEIAVVDEDSGLMLYGLAPHNQEAPASTTKIATADVALRQ